MFDLMPGERAVPMFLGPRHGLRGFSCGWYGVGHTARRHPGDMRGTVFGKKSRFRDLRCERGVEL